MVARAADAGPAGHHEHVVDVSGGTLLNLAFLGSRATRPRSSSRQHSTNLCQGDHNHEHVRIYNMGGATLIVGDVGIGDMILAHGFFQVLKKQEPDNPIDVIATERNAPIPMLFPEVRKVLIRPEKTAGGLKFNRHLLTYLKREVLGAFALPRLLYQIKRGKYSKAYTLRYSPKDAWMPHFTGIPERIGHLSTKNSHVLLTKSYAGLEGIQHKSRSIAMFGHPEGCNLDATPPISFRSCRYPSPAA